MILYHGSNVEIVEIDLQKSRPNKDFGRGFYLSADHDQALRMAQFKTKIEGGSPFVTEYEFDDTLMNVTPLPIPPHPPAIRACRSTRPSTRRNRTH